MFVLTAVWTSAANAAPAWFTAEVKGAGMSAGRTAFVRLTDLGGAFPAKWFIANPTIRNEMLAMALTAMATNILVTVNTDLLDGTFPEVLNLFLINN